MPKGSGIITPFKDYVAEKPDVKGDWGGTLGAKIPEAPAATPDELQGHDCVEIEGAPKAGAIAPAKIPGS